MQRGFYAAKCIDAGGLCVQDLLSNLGGVTAINHNFDAMRPATRAVNLIGVILIGCNADHALHVLEDSTLDALQHRKGAIVDFFGVRFSELNIGFFQLSSNILSNIRDAAEARNRFDDFRNNAAWNQDVAVIDCGKLHDAANR